MAGMVGIDDDLMLELFRVHWVKSGAGCDSQSRCNESKEATTRLRKDAADKSCE
jgi:hypothetical protein